MPISKKTRCKSCKVTNCLMINCKFCKDAFCTFCLMPEKHCCDNISECKQKSKDRLTNELMNNKCVKTKIESI